MPNQNIPDSVTVENDATELSPIQRILEANVQRVQSEADALNIATDAIASQYAQMLTPYLTGQALNAKVSAQLTGLMAGVGESTYLMDATQISVDAIEAISIVQEDDLKAAEVNAFAFLESYDGRINEIKGNREALKALAPSPTPAPSDPPALNPSPFSSDDNDDNYDEETLTDD